MGLDRVIRLGGGLLIGVWVTRYLGPSQYGIFNTLIALHSIALTVCGLGFESIISRYFVRYPRHSPVLLGTVVTIRALLGLLTGLTILIYRYFFSPFQDVSYWVWVFMVLSLVLTAFTSLRYYYDARGESKYVILPELVSFGVSSLLRVIGILYHFSVEWFLGVLLIEGSLGLVGYHLLYWRSSRAANWRFRFSIARVLFRQSWPILLSSGAAIMYFKMDQMMLFALSGSYKVGIYSVAVRISEIAYLFPTIVATAILPALTKLRKGDRLKYHHELRKVFSLLMAAAYGVALLISVCAPVLVSVLYGKAFLAASPILIVHIWSLVWIINSAIGHIYISNEGLTRYYLIKDSVAALLNVGLNFLLIPMWGGLGAAVATLVSYSFTAYWAHAVIPALRPLFKIQTDGLRLAWVFEFVPRVLTRTRVSSNG